MSKNDKLAIFQHTPVEKKLILKCLMLRFKRLCAHTHTTASKYTADTLWPQILPRSACHYYRFLDHSSVINIVVDVSLALIIIMRDIQCHVSHTRLCLSVSVCVFIFYVWSMTNVHLIFYALINTVEFLVCIHFFTILLLSNFSIKNWKSKTIFIFNYW